MKKLLGLAAALVMGCSVAQAGVLDTVRQRGAVACGVNTGLSGFSAADSSGVWRGLDVDLCRAVAAAVLGDASKVRYITLTDQVRFTALQSGEIDMLSRNTTMTFLRDATIGLRGVGVNFYDGQGFAVRKSANIGRSTELAGATICLLQGSTHEMNIADWMRQNNIQAQPVMIDTPENIQRAFLSGRCDAVSNDASALASMLASLPNPDEYMILPDLISKEPLGPMVRAGDEQWYQIVHWVLMGLIEAEEQGITAANVEQVARESQNPGVLRMLGRSGEFGKQLGGLNPDWMLQAIKQVGNYGESFERNVGPGSPLRLPRGMNALWNKGGLMYAWPFR